MDGEWWISTVYFFGRKGVGSAKKVDLVGVHRVFARSLQGHFVSVLQISG